MSSRDSSVAQQLADALERHMPYVHPGDESSYTEQETREAAQDAASDVLPLLWAAYLAGFDESGEGFNGEYVGRSLREPGALEARLRPEFDRWIAGEPPRC